jgi:RNA recognition motif-containing protein
MTKEGPWTRHLAQDLLCELHSHDLLCHPMSHHHHSPSLGGRGLQTECTCSLTPPNIHHMPFHIPPIPPPAAAACEEVVRYPGVVSGPEGANLFVFHLPSDVTESRLQALFRPYGNVISVR